MSEIEWDTAGRAGRRAAPGAARAVAGGRPTHTAAGVST
jgi:hypothetical protein